MGMDLISTETDMGIIINATMNADYQLSDKALCTDIIIEVVGVIQTHATDRNGEEKVATTLIAKDGTTYQTLSDFYDRVIHNIAEYYPPENWKEKPIKIQNTWKTSKNGQQMLAPKMVS